MAGPAFSFDQGILQTDGDAALKAADFDSVHGNLQFGDNHHPIQDIYVPEVVKEGEVPTNRIVSASLEQHAAAYAGDCQFQGMPTKKVRAVSSPIERARS